MCRNATQLKRSVVRTNLSTVMLTAVISLSGCQTGAETALPPVVKPNNANFPQTTNSITAVANGKRRDPEGVAAESSVNKVTWKDARGADRSMVLGGYLYQYDFTFNDNLMDVSRTANDDAYGHEGFGYVVSHNNQNGNSPLGKSNTPSKVETRVLAGGHHALHRVELVYDRDREGGGNGIRIPVVIEWLVATGRDHPVWSVTWRTGAATNPGTSLDMYRMDSRAPYGSLNYDGAVNRNSGDAIGGVSWGDAGFKFTTTDAQLTLNSPWTYDTANTVNFTRSWTATINAEMGIVQTKVLDKEMGYGDRVVGRERGKTSAAAFTNKGDCVGFSDPRVYSLPCVNGWPYQLMNYDWDPGTGKPAIEATGTKLMAWGTPYGFLGSSSFGNMDNSGNADGRGDRSYATFIVLGPKNRFNAVTAKYELDGDVALTIKAVEALAAAKIAPTAPFTLATQAPRGPGATDQKTLVNGYNDTRTAYELVALNNQSLFTFTPATGKPVTSPIFVLRNYTSGKLPTITINGAAVTVNDGTPTSGTFVSLNEADQELWVTVNSKISAATTVAIASP